MGHAFSQVVKGIGVESSPKSIAAQIERISLNQVEISKDLVSQNALEYNHFFNTILNEFKLKLQKAVDLKQTFFLLNGLRFVVPYTNSYYKKFMQNNQKSEQSLLTFANKHFAKNSLDFFSARIISGKILVNNQKVPINYILRDKDIISETVDFKLEPPIYDQDINIIAENSEYYVIDKFASMPIKTCQLYKKNSLYSSLENLRDYHFVHPASASPKEQSGLVFLNKKASRKDNYMNINNINENVSNSSIGRLSYAYARVGGKVSSMKYLSWQEAIDGRSRMSNLQPHQLVTCNINISPIEYDANTNTTLIGITPVGERPIKQFLIRQSLWKAGHPVINDTNFGREFAINPYMMSKVNFEDQKSRHSIMQEIKGQVEKNVKLVYERHRREV